MSLDQACRSMLMVAKSSLGWQHGPATVAFLTSMGCLLACLLACLLVTIGDSSKSAKHLECKRKVY